MADFGVRNTNPGYRRGLPRHKIVVCIVAVRAHDLTMGQVEQSRQFAAACRDQLTMFPAQLNSDTSLLIARSRETIEESRALLIEADQILGGRWGSLIHTRGWASLANFP